MKKIHWLPATVALTAAALLIAGCSSPGTGAPEPGSEDTYEPRNPTMLIPFAPGGGLDLAGRTVVSALEEEGLVDPTIQITNMPGGGAGVGMQHLVSNSAGDGDALMVIAAHVVLTPMTAGSGVTYEDMTPIARLYSETQIIAVAADSPLKSMDDLAEALVDDPSSITIGGASAVGLDSVVAGKLALELGVDPKLVKFVSYDGSTPIAALLGGHIDVALGGHEMIDLISSGEMRALAVTAGDRLSGDFADIPTIEEQGIDLVQSNWRMIFGPPDMPEAAVDYWRATLKDMSESDAWVDAMERYSFQPDFADTDLEGFLEQETDDFRASLEGLGLIK